LTVPSSARVPILRGRLLSGEDPAIGEALEEAFNREGIGVATLNGAIQVDHQLSCCAS